MKLNEISDKKAADDIEKLDPTSKEVGKAFSRYLNSMKIPLSLAEFDYLTAAYYMQVLDWPNLTKAKYFTDQLHLSHELIDLSEEDFDIAFKANPSYFDSSL